MELISTHLRTLYIYIYIYIYVQDGAERYLGYAAAVARLKLILLRAKSVVLYKAGHVRPLSKAPKGNGIGAMGFENPRAY